MKQEQYVRTMRQPTKEFITSIGQMDIDQPNERRDTISAGTGLLVDTRQGEWTDEMVFESVTRPNWLCT